MNMRDKIIVITGASRGFGQALARAFAKEGARVVVSGRNQSEVVKLAKEIHGLGIVADVTNETQVENLAKETSNKFKRIDMWVNNAGMQFPPEPIESLNLKQAQETMDVNFLGTVIGSKIALGQMKKQGFGTIFNIISSSALKGVPGLSIYAASKFAANGFTKTLRLEAPSNISILSVFPGGMKTHLFDKQKPEEYATYMELSYVIEKIINNLKKDHPDEELIIPRPGA